MSKRSKSPPRAASVWADTLSGIVQDLSRLFPFLQTPTISAWLDAALPSSKDRLYVALYARGGQPKMMPGQEDKFHWAFIVGPKREPPNGKGMRYHVKNIIDKNVRNTWMYDPGEIKLRPKTQLLVRIFVGRVVDKNRLVRIFQQVPIVQDDPDWKSVLWIKEALRQIEADGKVMAECTTDWKTVRDASMLYCQSKIDQGRFRIPTGVLEGRAPTYDLVCKQELVS